MNKAATGTKAATDKIMEQLEKEVLADGDFADLYRDAGTYNVNVILLPEMKKPEEACVMILTRDKKKIDTFTVPVDQAVEVVHHPTAFSKPLLDFIQGGEKKKPAPSGKKKKEEEEPVEDGA